MVYSNTSFYGGVSMVNPVTFLYFLYFIFYTYFKKLNDVFEVQFLGLHSYTLSKTLVACRARQLRFQVETLLNNAFKNYFIVIITVFIIAITRHCRHIFLWKVLQVPMNARKTIIVLTFLIYEYAIGYREEKSMVSSKHFQNTPTNILIN